MQDKMITVRREWLKSVASLLESVASLSKEGLDLSGQPPEEILIDISENIKRILKGEGEVMENTYYMSSEILDEVLTMPNDVRSLYREALRLITEDGTEPESAFKQSGFVEAMPVEPTDRICTKHTSYAPLGQQFCDDKLTNHLVPGDCVMVDVVRLENNK